MTISPLFNLRRVIPRWRDSKTTLLTGELISTFRPLPQKISGIDLFPEKLHLWRTQGGIENAAEVVSAAVSQEFYNEAIDAAEYILGEGTKTTQTVLSIAKQVLIKSGKEVRETLDLSQSYIGDREKLYKRIHDIRKLLNDYPRNALMWADLSLAYVALGQLQQSRDGMVRAIILAPNNRFILRSATRLFVHLDEPDTAHNLLFSNEVTKFDPWLIAAEIATASVAEINPRLVRQGKDILERKKFAHYHIAELASALATLELNSGSFRNARKLFQLSLIEPTENTVAQSVWVKKDIPTLETNVALGKTPRIYEAQALDALFNLNWSKAMEASQLWLADEAFSSRPAELGSYAASLGLENYTKAEYFARIGLIANPNDLTLLNNLAFALANQDKLSEALAIIQNAPKQFGNPSEEVALIATEGLIDIRKGEVEKGRTFYMNAISLARKAGRIELYALALINFAREMFLANQFTKNEALSIAENASRSTSNQHVHFLLNRLRNMTPKSSSEIS
jgi:tetratricopeptide (TPR) repeat protein